MSAPKMFLQRERGSSLVEILVALAIQAILLAAVAQFFGVSARVLRTQSAIADIQESGRFAANLLTIDIRSAGYAGCRHLAELNPNIIADDFDGLDSVDDGIRVFNNGSGWTAPTGFTATSGSDVVVIRYAGPSARVAERMTSDNANLKIENNPDDIEANDVVLVTDCVKSDIFRATSVSNNSGNGNSSVTMAHANNANSTNRLSKVYDTNAFVYAMRQTTYFVGSNGDSQGLYRQEKDTSDPVLISNDVNLLSATIQEDDEGFTVGVRYALLLATDNGVATASAPFVFEGVTLNGSNGDTRIRKSYVGFANIRNNSQ